MPVRPYLFGGAAILATFGAALAADLPASKSEAVEYVKVCSTFGPGFFYIPGSDTCLKIGGEMRADYRVFGGDGGYRVPGLSTGKLSRDDDRSSFNTQARLWFDARTQTDYGLLRSYFQIDADSHPIRAQGRGGIESPNTFAIDRAFLQFGGLTAGYSHSFFGFYDNEWGDTIWAPYYAQTSVVDLIAYTAQFSPNLNATLSIEDGRDHRIDSGVGVFGVASTGLQGGQQAPDVVGQLRYDAAWGSLAVQGALHQLRTAETITLGTPVNTTTALPHDDKWGYAVGATGLLRLPFIDGGHFIVEGQYADGAAHYLGAANTVFVTAPGDLFAVPGADNSIAFGRAKGWSAVAELGGNITPKLNANLVGSYIDTSADNFFGIGRTTRVNEFTLAGNLNYAIARGLTISAEVAYTRSKIRNALAAATLVPVNDAADAWQAGLRLRRTF